MKKRYITVTLISLILVLAFIIIAISSNGHKTFKEDGITYALMVDGNSATSFPTKGMYQVDTECDGAKGVWDYDNWKLDVKNITGNISCDISFNSISKEYLNQKIIGLSETEQGIGQVVHENANIPDYSNVTDLNQSQYLSVNAYSSTSVYSTSGTEVSNVFTYSGTEWSTNPSTMTSNTYYHFKFNVPEDGYYQMCYTLSKGNTNNYMYLYQNTTSIYDLYATSSSQNGCKDIGYVSTSDSLRIVQRAYPDIATVSISIKKYNNVTTKDAGYRYEGKNPNNYVWFNNELWRIIGVFDENSHGQTGQKLVKIIREDSLGGLAWNKSGTNNWETSSLKALLNGAYYNRQDGTDSGYCYGYYSSVQSNCDYTGIGINSSYRSMIKNVTWYLGGHSDTSVTTEAIYGYERGSETGNSNANPTSEEGYIGLMYPSDYGYSVLSSSCARIRNLSSYNGDTCARQSWLYKEGDEWTLSPYSGSSDGVFNLNRYGQLEYRYQNDVYYGYHFRPALYLDSSVYVLDGDGSMLDPYIIGM